MEGQTSYADPPGEATGHLHATRSMQVAKIDEGSHVRLQDVVVGDVLGVDTQVLSGLASTDKIVGSPSLGLLDGQAVQVVQPSRGTGP